jgi:integrase
VRKAFAPPAEMFPLNEAELELTVRRAAERNQRLADILLIDAWTGLRWSELRALRVRDFVEVPAAHARDPTSGTRGGAHQGDEVGEDPADAGRGRVLPLVRALAAGREGDALLFVTDSGSQLHASAFKRTLHWPDLAQGRRIHDLRHTAACLWLARGVDPVTVQAWMGHASIATTNLYLHHLGTSADRAGLDRLNGAGHAGGTRPGPESELQR